MSIDNNFQECNSKKCCTSNNSITEREEAIIQLACQFMLGNTNSIKDSIIKAKLIDLTTEDIEKICLLAGESAKNNILLSINAKVEAKKNNCCI